MSRERGVADEILKRSFTCLDEEYVAGRDYMRDQQDLHYERRKVMLSSWELPAFSRVFGNDPTISIKRVESEV